MPRSSPATSNRFLTLAPAYGGSLVLRAPFAALPALWGGGTLAVYRLAAAPCLLASVAFGVWLVARMRAAGRGRLARCGRALPVRRQPAHVARRSRPGTPRNCSARCCASWPCSWPWRIGRCGRGSCSGSRSPTRNGRCSPRDRSCSPCSIDGPRPSPRRPPSREPSSPRSCWRTRADSPRRWAPWRRIPARSSSRGSCGGSSARMATSSTGSSAPSSPAIARRRGGSARSRTCSSAPSSCRSPRCACAARAADGDALLLLALLLLLRCALDPWNTGYYALPFVFALLVWETRARAEPPALTLAASFAAWAVMQWLPDHASADLQALAFAALAVPAIALLGLAVYAPNARRRAPVLDAKTEGGRGGLTKCPRGPAPLQRDLAHDDGPLARTPVAGVSGQNIREGVTQSLRSSEPRASVSPRRPGCHEGRRRQRGWRTHKNRIPRRNSC